MCCGLTRDLEVVLCCKGFALSFCFFENTFERHDEPCRDCIVADRLDSV